MVKPAQIPFDCGCGKFFARGVERLVFPRFAQGAVGARCADARTIGKPALAAATRSQGSLCRGLRGAGNVKQSQFGGTDGRRARPALRGKRRDAGRSPGAGNVKRAPLPAGRRHHGGTNDTEMDVSGINERS